jgi:hypothetical protein
MRREKIGPAIVNRVWLENVGGRRGFGVCDSPGPIFERFRSTLKWARCVKTHPRMVWCTKIRQSSNGSNGPSARFTTLRFTCRVSNKVQRQRCKLAIAQMVETFKIRTIDIIDRNHSPIYGSYPMAVDVMLCYVHVAYVHIRHSNAFGNPFPTTHGPTAGLHLQGFLT